MKIIENWEILTTKGFVDISKANGLIGLDLYLREYKIKILDKRLDYYSILNNDYYFVKGYEPVTNKEWLGYKNDKEYDLENDKKYIQMINNQIKFYKENKSYIVERYTRKYINKYIKKITYPIKYKMLEEIDIGQLKQTEQKEIPEIKLIDRKETNYTYNSLSNQLQYIGSKYKLPNILEYDIFKIDNEFTSYGNRNKLIVTKYEGEHKVTKQIKQNGGQSQKTFIYPVEYKKYILPTPNYILKDIVLYFKNMYGYELELEINIYEKDYKYDKKLIYEIEEDIIESNNKKLNDIYKDTYKDIEKDIYNKLKAIEELEWFNNFYKETIIPVIEDRTRTKWYRENTTYATGIYRKNILEFEIKVHIYTYDIGRDLLDKYLNLYHNHCYNELNPHYIKILEDRYTYFLLLNYYKEEDLEDVIKGQVKKLKFNVMEDNNFIIKTNPTKCEYNIFLKTYRGLANERLPLKVFPNKLDWVRAILFYLGYQTKVGILTRHTLEQDKHYEVERYRKDIFITNYKISKDKKYHYILDHNSMILKYKDWIIEI